MACNGNEEKMSARGVDVSVGEESLCKQNKRRSPQRIALLHDALVTSPLGGKEPDEQATHIISGRRREVK
jgi:hypothetical protein